MAVFHHIIISDAAHRRGSTMDRSDGSNHYTPAGKAGTFSMASKAIDFSLLFEE